MRRIQAGVPNLGLDVKVAKYWQIIFAKRYSELYIDVWSAESSIQQAESMSAVSVFEVRQKVRGKIRSYLNLRFTVGGKRVSEATGLYLIQPATTKEERAHAAGKKGSNHGDSIAKPGRRIAVPGHARRE